MKSCLLIRNRSIPSREAHESLIPAHGIPKRSHERVHFDEIGESVRTLLHSVRTPEQRIANHLAECYHQKPRKIPGRGILFSLSVAAESSEDNKESQTIMKERFCQLSEVRGLREATTRV